MAIKFNDTSLYAGRLLRIVDIRWHAHETTPTDETQIPFAEITFQRTGTFIKHHGSHRVACDPNTLLFINPDEPYRLSHPEAMDCGCTALLLDPAVLADIVRRYDPRLAERPRALFAFRDCPSNHEFTFAHRRLFELTRTAGGQDALAIEEAGLDLAQRVVGAAMRFHGRRAQRARPSTTRAHTELTQAVKEMLSARYGERLALADIAAHVHSAATHLCWVFKRQTGLSIHRYRTRLRLHEALERLVSGPCNLARLAAQLGFAHHSHFTVAFRREFGVPPSRAAALAPTPVPADS